MQLAWAKIIRRESYFRAVIVQSRGNVAGGCSQKCGRASTNRRFEACVRIDGYQGGACAECVWQSHGARCDHHDDNQPSDSDDDDSDDEDYDSEDEDDDDEARSQREDSESYGPGVKIEPDVIDPWRNAMVVDSDSE